MDGRFSLDAKSNTRNKISCQLVIFPIYIVTHVRIRFANIIMHSHVKNNNNKKSVGEASKYS